MGFLSGLASSLTGGDVLGGVIGIGSGLLGAKGAKDTNSAAQANSQAQMDFQERMSSTAHQREVKDLIKAGLNPILSANGGASSPSGAVAPVINSTESGLNSARASSSIAMQKEQLAASIKLMDEQSKTSTSQAALNAAQLFKTEAETEKVRVETGNSALAGREIAARTGAIGASTNQTIASTREAIARLPLAEKKAALDSSKFGTFLTYVNAIKDTLNPLSSAFGSARSLIGK